MVLRLGLAAALGALVAFRVWRRFLPQAPAPSMQYAQAQTLIAAAGALMVVLIGDNQARAFGLVGLGAFIRFRSGIKDPRDAGVMFVMIGIGMACGLGLPVLAIVVTSFFAFVLGLHDVTGRTRLRRAILSVTTDTPVALAVKASLSAMFPLARVLEVAVTGADKTDAGRVVLEVDLASTMDAQVIFALLSDRHATGIRRVHLEE
jgi:hypothetical protein